MQYFSDEITARFNKFVRKDGECLRWTVGKTPDGYGLFRVAKGIVKTAHRYAKETALEERIPRHLDASHLCPNRDCVNPAHIVVETRKENVARIPRKPRYGVTKSVNRWRAYYFYRGTTVHIGYYA